MSSQFDLSARITGDATGLVGAAKQGEEAIKDVGTASQTAATGAAALNKSTESAAAAMTKAGRSAAEQAAATQRIANASAALDIAQTRSAAAVAALAIAHDKAAKAADNDAAAQLRITNSLARAEAAVLSTSLAQSKAAQKLVEEQGKVPRVLDEGTKAANRQQYAVRNVGQQFGDFGLQVAGGTSIARAFGQQAGQLGYALSEMGGRLGKVGAFLTGPWGIALTIAAAFVAPLVEELFKTAEATKAVEIGSNGLSTAQGALGEIFDLNTGKLKKLNSELSASNELLRLNARLTAINLRTEALKEAADSKKALAEVGKISTGNRVGGFFEAAGQTGNVSGALLGALAGTQRGNQNATNLRGVVADLQAGRTTNEQALRAAEKIDFSGLKVDREGFLKAIVNGVSSSAKRQIADLTDKALDTNTLPDALKNDTKTKRPKKPKSTEARDEFGRDAADRIANIVGQFDEAPAVIDKTNAKIRQLDDLIDDLGRKKPAGFADLIASAEAAKVTVRDGLIREVAKSFEQPKTLADKAAAAFGQLDAVIADLNKNKPTGFDGLIESAERTKGVIAEGLQKPYRDFIEDQRDGLAVQQLLTAGRIDEANALKTVQGLQKTMGPLTDAQKDSVLATVQAMRLEQRQLEIRNELQAKYLTAIGSIKGVVQDATQAFVRGDLGQLIKAPQKLLDSFLTLKGDKIFDNLFGGVFRDLTDQVNGVSPVKDAGKRMAAAVDEVADKSKVVVTSFGSIKPPIDAATKALGGFTAALNKAAGVSIPANDNSSSSSLPGGTTIEPDGTIRVEANSTTQTSKNPTVPGDKIDPFATSIDKIFSKIGIKDPQIFGRSIGQNAGKAFEGAATGTLVNGFLQPLGKALGFKTSKVGAQIGGAVGSFLPIPFGKEVGAVVGSVIGGLFKKDKFGSSTLSVTNGQAVAGTAIGSGKAAKEQADALGSSLADGLNSVVAALGAQLGTANVSIGYRPGHKAGAYRVDTTGGGAVAGGDVQAFETEAEAVAFAIRDAILDGGVTGLSAAMQKALTSNTDIDRAVQEALGVKALETALGGVQGALKAQFDAEDAAGRERVRLAKAYGLDLVAVEKLNGEQRAALVEATLKSRLGSLSDTLNSLKFGDLFEGSAADKLKALQVQIDAAQKDAEAGKAGAADTLASLLQQKVGTARDAYGTAGPEYTNARGDALSAIDRVIKMETDRVNAAANGTGTDAAAMAAQTAIISEGVDVQVQTLAEIRNLSGILAGTGSANDYSPNLDGIARKAAA